MLAGSGAGSDGRGSALGRALPFLPGTAGARRPRLHRRALIQLAGTVAAAMAGTQVLAQVRSYSRLRPSRLDGTGWRRGGWQKDSLAGVWAQARNPFPQRTTAPREASTGVGWITERYLRCQEHPVTYAPVAGRPGWPWPRGHPANSALGKGFLPLGPAPGHSGTRRGGATPVGGRVGSGNESA